MHAFIALPIAIPVQQLWPAVAPAAAGCLGAGAPEQLVELPWHCFAGLGALQVCPLLLRAAIV